MRRDTDGIANRKGTSAMIGKSSRILGGQSSGYLCERWSEAWKSKKRFEVFREKYGFHEQVRESRTVSAHSPDESRM